MAFPVVVSSVAAQRTPAATSTSIAIPSGAVAGDLIVVLISVDIAEPVTSTTDGWTRLVHRALTETFAVFVARAGSASAPLVMTHGLAGAAWRTFLVRNVHATQAVEAASLTQTAGLGSTLPVPSITPTWGGADAMYLLGVMSVWPGNGPTTAPTGYANRETSILGAATIGTEVDTARRIAQVVTEAPAPWTGGSALVAYASAILAIRGVDSTRTAAASIGIGGQGVAVAQIARTVLSGAVGVAGQAAGVARIEGAALAGLLLAGAVDAIGMIERSAAASVGVGGLAEGFARGLSAAVDALVLYGEPPVAIRGPRSAGAAIGLAGSGEALGSISTTSDAALGLEGVAGVGVQALSDAVATIVLDGSAEREPRGVVDAGDAVSLSGEVLAAASVAVEAASALMLGGAAEAHPSLVTDAGAGFALDGWGVTTGASFDVVAMDGFQLGGTATVAAVVEAEVIPDAIDLMGRGTVAAPMMSGTSSGVFSIQSRPAAMVRLFSIARADLMLSDTLGVTMMLEHITSGGITLGGAAGTSAWDEAWPTCIGVAATAESLTVSAEADTLVLTAESAELTLEAEC